jgi:methionyl aminopeptidase
VGIKYKSRDEIAKMRETNMVVSAILDDICAAAVPGASTWDLDRIAADGIRKHKVTSAFLGYYGYPAVLCTSINEVVVHGIPRKDEVLKAGDIIGIDFGVFKDGYCGDSARTVPVGPWGELTPEKQKLVRVTWEALQAGISQCFADNRLGDIGHAVQNHVESNGFSVVRQFVGHGIGRAMHEDPPVPNYGRAGTEKRIKTGLVIAVEPMVNAGTHEVEVLQDKWTAVTKDRRMSAHFEHSIAITEEGPWVLSRASSTPGDPGTDQVPWVR